MPSMNNNHYARPIQPSLDGSSAGSLIFDYEHQLPKQMCGAGVLTKLGLLAPVAVQQERRSESASNRRGNFGGIFRRKSRDMHGVDLQPINTLFVTEHEYINQGLSGNTSSETSEPTVSDETSTATQSTLSFPQFDIKTGKIKLYQVKEEALAEASSPEMRATPKTTNTVNNKHFDFEDFPQDAGNTFLPKVSPANRLRKNKLRSPKHHRYQQPEQLPLPNPVEIVQNVLETSVLETSITAAEEDLARTADDFSKDDFSISTKDTPTGLAPSQQLGDAADQERILCSMQGMITRQQENLHTLANKNQHYRDRLSASHGKVQELNQEHLKSKNAITKLQFERESFEAEAMWLREELKSVRGMVASMQKAEDKPSPEVKPAPASQVDVREPTNLFSSNGASSELRWKRPQSFVLASDKVPDTIETATTVVEELPSPVNWNAAAPTSSPVVNKFLSIYNSTSPLESPETKHDPAVEQTPAPVAPSLVVKGPSPKAVHCQSPIAPSPAPSPRQIVLMQSLKAKQNPAPSPRRHRTPVSTGTNKANVKFFPPSPTEDEDDIIKDAPVLVDILNNAQRLASPMTSPVNHHDAKEADLEHPIKTPVQALEPPDEYCAEEEQNNPHNRPVQAIESPQPDTPSKILESVSSPLKRYLEATKNNKSQPVSPLLRPQYRRFNVQSTPVEPESAPVDAEPETALVTKQLKLQLKPLHISPHKANFGPSAPISQRRSPRTAMTGEIPTTDLARQYIMAKKQAVLPTYPNAQANAEMRWVKSQQQLLANFKTSIVDPESPTTRAIESSPSPSRHVELKRRVDLMRKTMTPTREQQQPSRSSPKSIIRSPDHPRHNKRVTIQVPSVDNNNNYLVLQEEQQDESTSHYQIRKGLTGKDAGSEQSI